MSSLSLCLIARDEEVLLPGLLNSVIGVADEVVCGVDDRSTDCTAEIARHHGARVYMDTWQDSFAIARNRGLKKAKGDWVLIMDADDRLTPWGAQQVKAAMRTPRSDIEVYGFVIQNRRLDETVIKDDPLPSMRLFRNHQGIHYVNRAHEELRGKDGKTLTLGWLRGKQGEVGIVTYGYDPTLYAARNKDERNLQLILRQLADNPDDRIMLYELARQHRIGKRFDEARQAAQKALALPAYLRPELIAELEQIAGSGVDALSARTTG